MNEQTFNMKFVAEVEKHPILYNYTLVGYSRKDLTEKSWCEVGEQMQMKASDCKEKWKNLRAVFVRNIKFASSSSELKRRKPYYLTEAMQFTLPFIKTLNKLTHVNLPIVSKAEQDMFDEVDSEDNSIQNTALLHHPLPSPTPPTSEPPSTSGTDQQSQALSDYCPTSKATFIRKRTPRKEYFAAKKTKNTATNCKNCRQSQRTKATKHFLLSLLPELEEMTDQQIKVFKRKILLFIDDILGQDLSMPTESIFSPASTNSSDFQPVPTQPVITKLEFSEDNNFT